MKRILSLLSVAVLGPAMVHAAGNPVVPEEPLTEKSALSEWWNGRYASGNWFGVRDSLIDRGVDIRVNWRANFLAIVDGGLQQRGGFDQEINFDLNLDFAKLTQVENLEGLSFTGNVRWREADYSVNQYSGTDGTFRPSAYTGGFGWRFRKAYFTYTTPELFGIPKFLTLSGGWQVPTDLFLVQPESKLFVNQTIRTAKGINPNVPWGGSFSTWGGYIKLEPTDWAYAQSGLYLAYPFGTDPNNNGLAFAGYRRDLPLNGLYSITELGVTPKIGPEQLPGKYAAGFIFWGQENIGFDGVPYDGRLQFYWQADQQLFRERSIAPKPVYDSKGGKNVVSVERPKGDDQGLYWFSTLNFAPPANNVVQFYALGGLVYKGLIPGRDRDQTGVAFAYGDYSFDSASRDRSRGTAPRTYQAVLEFDYRIQINRFAYVQPVLQYIIRPGARGLVANDTIIGLHFGANF